MNVSAESKFVRLSPAKARGLVRRMRDISVEEALKITDLSGGKAGRLIGKTLKSAVANARNNAKMDVDKLQVKDAIVNQGPSYRRYWARARGMTRPILRKTCHIKVVLTDGENAED
ncbi:MAG: 50S ribosomal protein L22 [Kiritimatiellia bacterium]